MRPNQPRQKCPKCPAVYRWPNDFEEHLRVAHKPQEDNTNRPTFSDKDADEALDSIEVAPE
jgi:uncharacterized C2H2 Zn-finger protein